MLSARRTSDIARSATSDKCIFNAEVSPDGFVAIRLLPSSLDAQRRTVFRRSLRYARRFYRDITQAEFDPLTDCFTYVCHRSRRIRLPCRSASGVDSSSIGAANARAIAATGGANGALPGRLGGTDIGRRYLSRPSCGGRPMAAATSRSEGKTTW